MATGRISNPQQYLLTLLTKAYENYNGISRKLKEGREEWRVELNGNILTLIHYYKPILKIYKNQILYIYAESNTDTRAINTTLDYHNFEKRVKARLQNESVVLVEY